MIDENSGEVLRRVTWRVGYPTTRTELNDPSSWPADRICRSTSAAVTPEGDEREGEADFVVAHPLYGFLVIEVKGGAASRRVDTKEWYSKNRLGITNKIKYPVTDVNG